MTTACVNCNSKRRDQKVVDFLRSEGYDKETITEIVAVINKNRRVKIIKGKMEQWYVKA